MASRALSAVSAVVIFLSAGVLASFALFPRHAERYTAGRSAGLFYDADGVGQLEPGLLAVAHNSGLSVGSVRSALEHGATAIEVDVVAVGGRLYAAHEAPPTSLFLRRPTLATVWDASADADLVVLDIKQSSAAAAVAEFLDARPSRPVVVTSKSPLALDHFTERHLRLLSIDGPTALARAEPRASIDGVTVRHSLLDVPAVERFRAWGWQVLAWTVNEPARVEELAALGIDGITTDNLAILERLGATA